MACLHRFALALFGSLALGSAAGATGEPSHGGARDAMPRSAEATARFPQPVRVGDLIGRQVLEDRPNQQVLGHVQAITRGEAGRVQVLVRRSGWLGRGAGEVAVSVENLALLGQFVVLKDVPQDRFLALPPAPRPASPLDATATIQVGLARN